MFFNPLPFPIAFFIYIDILSACLAFYPIVFSFDPGIISIVACCLLGRLGLIVLSYWIMDDWEGFYLINTDGNLRLFHVNGDRFLF